MRVTKLFYRVHKRAIESAWHCARDVGDVFRIALQEPLGPVLGPCDVAEPVTLNTVTFRCTTRRGEYTFHTPADRQAVAEWCERHKHAIPDEWSLPTELLGP